MDTVILKEETQGEYFFVSHVDRRWVMVVAENKGTVVVIIYY